MLAMAPATHAAVVASLDRSDVELNESFTLKVTVDTAIDTEPDASALDESFHVLSRSELSNTMIVNGQISRSRTWTYVLMAREPGELTIPPVTVANEQSNPLSITVMPQTVALPGESDVFVATEVDHQDTYVQAQVLYRVKVYRAVATRQPRLFEPELSGVDVLVEVAGEERNYDSLINGKNYNVVERVYALFPQASGELSIAPARFEARVLRQGRITGRKVFQSESVTVRVQPIPPPPDDFPDAAWFPAKSVLLTEEWSREPDRLPAGEPITRHLTVTAAGQLSTQIPVIQPAETDGVKVYPDKPELRVAAMQDGVLATRKDQYAMIGVAAGPVRLPALELPWWNIERGEWQVATLPSRTLQVLPPPDILPLPQIAEEAAPVANATETVVVESAFWRRVSEILFGLWVATVAVLWIRKRRAVPVSAVEPEAPPVYRQQSRLLRKARRAARAGDPGAVRSPLLDWARLEWPENPPRNVGDIAARVAEPLASELESLGRASYGPRREPWDGSGLDRAMRSCKSLPRGKKAGLADSLPPLMPQGQRPDGRPASRPEPGRGRSGPLRLK